MRFRNVTAFVLAALAATLPAATAGSSPGSPQIAGGGDAEPGRYRFMASLQLVGGAGGAEQHFCGGTLVHAEWILTAAHCTATLHPSRFVVVIGRTRLSQAGGAVREVRAVVAHPDYDGHATHGADVALVRLSAPVRGIPPVPLVDRDDPGAWSPGRPATVVGWGARSAGSGAADHLREAPVVVVADSEMASSDVYGDHFKPSDMLGAGPAEGEDGPCFGDSGGPLLVGDGRRVRQLGIVSFGTRCGPGPAVYARLTGGRVRDFFDSRLGPQAAAA